MAYNIESLKKAAKFVVHEREKKMLRTESMIFGILAIILGLAYKAGHPLSYILIPMGILQVLNGLLFTTRPEQFYVILSRHTACYFISALVMVIDLVYKLLQSAVKSGVEIPSTFIIFGIFYIGLGIGRLAVSFRDKEVANDVSTDAIQQIHLLLDHLKKATPVTDPEMIKIISMDSNAVHYLAKPVHDHILVWADNNEFLEMVPINQFSLVPYYGENSRKVIKGDTNISVTINMGNESRMGYLDEKDIKRFNNVLQSLSEWSMDTVKKPEVE